MSTGSKLSRAELAEALDRAMRDASAKGVLYSQTVADRLGVNSSDLECLDLVALRGPLTAGEIAEAAGLTTGAITGVIDRLEKAGFARRQRDDQDRRKVLVTITPAVERRIAPLYRPMARAAMATLTRYDDQELALILDFIERSSAAATVALAELRGDKNGDQPMKSGSKSSRVAKRGKGLPTALKSA
jgi:DNA-binding MarR family transcriptional regulator